MPLLAAGGGALAAAVVALLLVVQLLGGGETEPDGQFVAAVETPAPQQDGNALVGRWREADGTEIVEFRPDGSVLIEDAGVTLTGEYEGFRLYVRGFFGETLAYELEVSENRLTATDSEGETTVYLREDGGPPSADSSIPDPRVAGMAPEASISLNLNDANFSRREITGNAGEVIELVVTNTGTISHNLVVAGPDDEYDTGDDFEPQPFAIQPGETGRVVLKIDDPGTYRFRCAFHPNIEFGTLTLIGSEPGTTTGLPPVSGETVTTDSGLRYIDIKVGSGPAPVAGQILAVHYTGWLSEDGSKFDSSLDRATPFKFTLGTGAVIAGWDEGLATMKEGGQTPADHTAGAGLRRAGEAGYTA